MRWHAVRCVRCDRVDYLRTQALRPLCTVVHFIIPTTSHHHLFMVDALKQDCTRLNERQDKIIHLFGKLAKRKHQASGEPHSLVDSYFQLEQHLRHVNQLSSLIYGPCHPIQVPYSSPHLSVDAISASSIIQTNISSTKTLGLVCRALLLRLFILIYYTSPFIPIQLYSFSSLPLFLPYHF